ncbi:MAG TPA: energy transducer TonB [Terriglobales bacterium]|jgi:TonB family protein|nr:energy transducer TonB [Terriglobales bacterium]
MDSQASQLTLGLLPEPRTRWGRFVFSYGVQSLVAAFFVITAILHPDVLEPRERDYHFVSLVSTPPPVPQTPAPVKHFPAPAPKITEPVTPRPEAMRVPAELVQKKPPVPEEQAPKVALAAAKEVLPDVKPMIPRPPVKTNVFSTGSSATPTMAAAPSKVQTGGFGDPNGVPNQDTHGHPITIAQAGSFDMPSGPGYGNGTGGSHGARGVVASTGFGSGVATGNSSGVSGSRGTVRQGAFGDADVVAASQPKTKTVDPVVNTLPVEITYKPRPVYTDEGRQLKIEGEVLLEVVFSANGQIRILKVVRGLGHGLDESAVRAAEKIQFKPALKDGHPADFEAVLHIEFQLAS